MAEQESYLAVLKASYDYDPQPDAEEELAIKENQILLLLERTDDDWWKVKVKTDTQDEDGAAGLVPSAYVEPAEHTAVAKALYDYEATQSTELSVKEEEILYVYGKDDDWLLVQSQADDTKVGYVPANYVEETTGEEATETPAAPLISQIVIPPSPQRPVSTYVDPADRVAAAPTKAQADDIQTWAVSEVDKKNKKKKGTLGIGNGAVFFASEADKTPVQKWQTIIVQSVKQEKSKHVHIDIGGPEPISLHFHAGSKDVAEAIIAKLEASRALAQPPRASESGEEIERTHSAQKAVHFDAAEPEIIPPRESSEYGAEEPQEEVPYVEAGGPEEGEAAIVLYDFTADGEDELSAQEGESLLVLERDGDEWWKCRNAAGDEGVVPASYVELVGVSGAAGSIPQAEPEPEQDTAAIAQAAAAKVAKEAEARAEVERQKKVREQAQKERAEKERKKQEAEQRAKAAAAAAEEERLQRLERQQQKERERAAATEEEAQKRNQRESAVSEPSSPRRKSNGDSSSRNSTDRRGPPPENTRVWHDRTGQFRVEAAFLGFANGKLRLHKVNGVVIEVPAEKMSPEDMRYIEKLNKKNTARKSSDDDEPLELRRRSLQPEPSRSNTTRAPPAKKGPTIDWFEFFLNAGCDIDDCTRYATSFERDKIDEALLPDITESTMRSLGLREGDIIRVKKAIDQRVPKSSASNSTKEEQLRRDEELAKQLQQEESRPRGQAPNLFAAGPNGALKNGSMRRGRPQPSKSGPVSSVDLRSITTASDQIQRTSSPQVMTPDATSPAAVQPPPRSSSALPVPSGFDDDAWTNRPSSTKPLTPTPTPPVAAPRAPSAPPPAPTPPVVASAPPAAAPTPPVPPPAPATPASTLAKTDNDIFDQLARLSALRTQSPAVAPPSAGPIPVRAPSVPVISPPPAGYQSGMGMGSSPVPIGQHLQNQQTGLLQSANTPRGPFAPVPANQSLLQPLIPTSSPFNSFVPTRPQSATPSFQTSPFQSQPQQPSFLSTQPTGFSPSPSLQTQMTGYPNQGPIMSQPTGMPNQGPMMSQPTGMPNGPVNGGFGPTPSFQNNNGFGQIQSNPTGFNPGFGQSPFNNGFNPAPPPVPSPPAAPNTSPANIFAQMKSGTFANDAAPQGADKYDALRPNPTPLAAQPTGWYNGMNGFQGGYGYQH